MKTTDPHSHILVLISPREAGKINLQTALTLYATANARVSYRAALSIIGLQLASALTLSILGSTPTKIIASTLTLGLLSAAVRYLAWWSLKRSVSS
jgi:hypothetical protein